MAESQKKEAPPEWALRLNQMIRVVGTQQEAAKIAGVSPRQLRKYISGRNRPPDEVIRRLAKASDFEPDYIFKGGRKEGAGSLIMLPGNMAGFLQLRRQQALRLLDVYPKDSWELPNEEADIIMSDGLELITEKLPPELWEVGTQLIAEGHRAALLHSSRRAFWRKKRNQNGSSSNGQ